ncbi:ankyrin repeat domain-containing protein [Chitinimonas arctica]|nr:ankyrin repeat domain-containing protein [Chitinimonas arctica]
MPYPEDWFEAEQLHRAALDGDIGEMAKLVADGFDVNLFDDISRAPLHYAVEGEQYKAAQWLLDHGAEVNAHKKDMIGETPLSFAVRRDYVEMVELLL